MSQEEFKIVLGAELSEADLAALEQRLNERFGNKKIKISVDNNSSKETEKNVNNINNAVKQTTKSTETFGQKLKNALHIGSAAALAYKGISLIRQAANNAVNSVKELNQSLTNLRIVTGANQTEAQNYMNTYNSMARELGATTTEVADTATGWLRQGKSIAETNQLIQDSVKLSKIGMVDSADATTYLTSALNGYKLEASQATNVVDKLAKLDSSAAVTAGGLSEAMSKTAVSADSAGVTMDRLLGYLSVVGETTQENMTIIGNAFKTFFARYTAIKSGKLELVDEDGTTEILSDVEQSLKNVGIDMRSTITEFDNAGDVLDNLYAKWNSLNGVQQNAIANAFGGVRQKERFLALMENYDKAREYMDLSANSAGAAEEKFGAYLDGIEAKSKSLQSAFEGLANNTISSDTIGNIQEATASLITFIDKSNLLEGALTGAFAGGAIKLFTMLKTGISSSVIKLNEFHSALSLIKAGNLGEAEISQLAQMTNNLSNSQLKAVLSSKSLSTEQRIAILTSQGLTKAEATAKLTTMGLATSENVAAGATSTLGGAFKGLWATLKANPLLLIVTGITATVAAFNTYKESVEKAQKATIDTAKESTDHIKELESSLKSYLELDTSATEADKASALKSVTEQINNKTEALKNATEAEKGYADAVKDSIQSDYQDAAGDSKDAAVAAKDKIAGQWHSDYTREVQVGSNKTDSTYNEVKDILGKYVSFDKYNIPGEISWAYYIGDTRNHNNIDTSDIDSLLAYYEKLQQAQEAVQQKALELGDKGGKLLESPLYKAISEIINNETNKTNIDDYISTRSEEIYNSTIVKQGIPETVEQFNKLKDIMLKQAGNSTLLADSIINRLNTAYGVLVTEAVKTQKSLSGIKFTIDDEEIEKQLKDLQEALSKVADNYKKISGVIDDYNKNGNMSIENLETLISVGDEYLSTLFDENGKLNLNKESYKKLAKARLEDIRYTMLENAISSINKLNKDDEATSNDNLATSTGNLTEEILKLVAAKKLAEGVDSSQIKKIVDTYYQWSSLIDNTEAGLENNIDATLGLENASGELKDSLESEKKSLENSKSALEDKKKALEDTKEGYETALNSIKSLIEWTEKYIKQTKEDEIKSLEEKKNAIDEQIDKQKELLQAEKDLHDYEQSLGEKQNTVASNALATSIASLDDSASGQKTYKQTQEEYKNSKDDLQDFLYDHNIEVREDALDKFKEDTDKSYESQIDTIQKYLDNEVQLHKDACSMIDNDNGELYGNLLNYCRTHTTTTEAEFNHMWQAAQSAMKEYNIANVGTFELLSSLQSRIYEVDTAIDVVADSISSYEYKIQGVQDSLTALSDSAIKAQNDIAKAMQDNNKWNEINKAKWYYDWQGVRYQSKEVERDSAIYDILHQIEKKYGGSLPASTSTIYGTIKKYATGTKSAKGGLSEIDENGKLETLMKQTPDGNYVIMDKGDQVFTKNQTDNLHDLSKDPAKFIYDNVDLNALAEKGLRPLTNKELSNLGLWNSRYSLFDNDVNIPNITNVSDKIYKDVVGGANLNDVVRQNVKQSINANFYNTFNGDVTPQMLRLMEKKEKDIVKKSVNEMIETTLKGRKWR